MRKEQGMSPEAIQALLDTIATLDTVDLSKLDQEVEARKTKKQLAEEAIERMEFKLTPPKRKKQHWRVAKRKAREYHQVVRKPRTAKRRALLLKEEGWYGILRELWERAGHEVEVTRAEWEEAVGTLDDVYPMVTRYDAAVGIRLDNVLVRDRDTLRVVFDGKEWSLRQAGYIL